MVTIWNTKPFGGIVFLAQQADKLVARKISASYKTPVSGPVKTAYTVYMFMAV